MKYSILNLIIGVIAMSCFGVMAMSCFARRESGFDINNKDLTIHFSFSFVEP